MERHQILNSLKSIFYGLKGYSDSTYSSVATVRNHNIFGKYFELIIEPEIKQFPVFKSYEIVKELIRNSSHYSYRLVIPLSAIYVSSKKRSCGTLIRDCFERNTGNPIYKCVTTNNIVYYGAPGVLFDADFNPLFIVFYDIEPIDTLENRLKVSGITIKVSPKVFLNTDRPLEKNIVNKIIPLYLSEPIAVSTVPLLVGGIFSPRIIVEDISSYIKSPTEPQDFENMDENLNNFLASRIDEDIASLL